MLLFVIVICLFFIYIFPWLWKRRHLYVLSWQLPGPFALPIIGNGLSFLNHEDNIRVTNQYCNIYDTPARFWLGTKMFVMLDDADDIENVLTSPHCMNKEDAYKYLEDAVSSAGLFTSSVTKWKRHRKLISPAFGLSAVYMYLPIFNKRLKEFTKKLAQKAEAKEIFDMRVISTEATMDMILETTLGASISDSEKKIYSHHLVIVENLASKRIFQPWFQLEWLWRLTSYPNEILKFKNLHTNIFDKIFKDRKAHGAEELLLVDKLIRVSEENKDFTYSDVAGESNTVMMAGSDTSAVGIATTLLLFALYPEYQERVYQEIKSVLPESLDNYEITREDIEKLELTERCIKEAIRVLPTVAIISRQNTQTIKINKYTIPPNTPIAINIERVHKNPKYWGNDVNRFDPDRFLPENLSKMHPYSYIAFSGGPRNCVGYKYAMIVIKMTLVYTLFYYRVTTPLKFKDIKYYMNINTDFVCKHMIQVHKR